MLAITGRCTWPVLTISHSTDIHASHWKLVAQPWSIWTIDLENGQEVAERDVGNGEKLPWRNQILSSQGGRETKDQHCLCRHLLTVNTIYYENFLESHAGVKVWVCQILAGIYGQIT